MCLTCDRVRPEEQLHQRCPPPGEDLRRLVRACAGDWEWARRARGAARGDVARALVAAERRQRSSRPMVVAIVKRAARDTSTAVPIGPLTRRALEGFRRTEAADAPPRRGQARGLTADECATVLATCLRPRRTGRGLERPKTAERRGLVDSAIVALLFHGALRRSEVAALCWADVDFSDGDDVVVTVRRAKTDPTGGRADVRRLGRQLRGRGPQPACRDHPGTGGFGRQPQPAVTARSSTAGSCSRGR